MSEIVTLRFTEEMLDVFIDLLNHNKLRDKNNRSISITVSKWPAGYSGATEATLNFTVTECCRASMPDSRCLRDLNDGRDSEFYPQICKRCAGEPYDEVFVSQTS